MLNVKMRGLSLIELMVAILIISILAAVSGPVYRSYTAKSKFAQVLQELNEYKNKLIDAYQVNDAFPDYIGDLSAGVYTAQDSDVLEFVYFNGNIDNKSIYLFGLTADLGSPGYVAPGLDGSGCSFCRVTVASMPTATGHIQTYCGQWDGTDEDVPLNMLPSSCQDTNIEAIVSI